MEILLYFHILYHYLYNYISFHVLFNLRLIVPLNFETKLVSIYIEKIKMHNLLYSINWILLMIKAAFKLM